MRSVMRHFALGLIAAAAMPAAYAQEATVSARVVVTHVHGKVRQGSGNENVIVWLTPLDRPAAQPLPPTHLQIVQKNKQFFPHVLAIPVGAEVEFPNSDPFFHNVFSLYRGERFDLGLYEAGRSRVVRFDRPGVSFIFCNIHSNMSAFVVALSTPYFGTSDARGRVTIADVPPGRYRLQVWYERADSAGLASLQRDITLPLAGNWLGTIHVVEAENAVTTHTDKYGHAYLPDHVPY